MAADVATSLKNVSTSEASNSPSGSTSISTNLDDNLRAIQAVVRQPWARDTIASATTTDIGTKDAGSITVSGTTTITGLGTVSDGIRKWLRFADALTLTHNATSLILPTAANITTAAGDVALMQSEGGGNWRCLSYMKANGQTIALSSTFSDGTVSLPGMAFTSDTDTGFYRIGANNMGLALNGAKYVDYGTAVVAYSTKVTVTTLSGAVYSLDNALSMTTNGGSAASITTGTNSGNTGSLTLGTGTSSLNNSGALVLSTGDSNSNAAGDLTILVGDANTAFANTGASLNIIGGNKTHASGTSHGTKVNIRSGWSANIGAFMPPAVNFQVQPSGGVRSIARLNGYRAVFEHLTPTGDSTAGASPTITSGAGSTGTIAGTNYGFKVTYGGTGITAAVQVALGAWGDGNPANSPVVTFALQGGTTITGRITALSTSSVTITMASAPSAGDVLHVMLQYFE